MFFGFDLKELFMFPFKDEEARKYFLVGCLVALAAFIVPILPYIVMFGYAVRISRQIMNNESPRMIPWDDWSGFAKDGIKIFGIRMVFTLPLMLILIPFILIMTLFPIFISAADSSNAEAFIPVFMVLMFGGLCCLIPLSLPLTIIIPGAEMHVAEKDDFAAGFKFGEWWPIFRANLSGFIAAFVITSVAGTVLTLAIQLIGATFILACLMFILIPAMTIYLTLVMYAVNAQAYRLGKEMLTQKELAPAPEQ